MLLEGAVSTAAVAANLGSTGILANLLLFPPQNENKSCKLAGVWNVASVLLFGASHSFLADEQVKEAIGVRDGGKLGRIWPQLYVFAASVGLGAVGGFWQRMGGGSLWKVPLPSFVEEKLGAFIRRVGRSVGIEFDDDVEVGRGALDGLLMLPGLLSIAYNVSHFGAFIFEKPGMEGGDGNGVSLVKDGMYGVVRHPMYLSLLLAMCSTTHMHKDRVLFVTGLVLYLLGFGIPMEEKKLEAKFGKEQYDKYRSHVPASLIPGFSF